MIDKPPTCQGCPAYETGKSFVRWTGPRDTECLLIGQGPGEEEARSGAPFVGKSGRHLNRWLAKAGISRGEVRVGNIVNCWLPNNRPPTAAEVEHCKVHWDGPQPSKLYRLVVPVGVPAMRAIFGPKAKASWAGRILKG